MPFRTTRGDQEKTLSQPVPEGATTIDDVRQALEALTNDELYRLHKAARSFVGGTEYDSSDDLFNEAVIRTLRAANGEKGRHWPKDVEFVAFLMQTMRGLANDSYNSAYVENNVGLGSLAPEDGTAEDGLGAKGHYHADVVTLAIAAGERAEARESAATAAAKIDEFFAGDDEVTWLVMGHKDGMKAVEIREVSGMTLTQYETARRRFRRGLENLFPGRSKK